MLDQIDNKLIIGNTINDIWRDALWSCVRNGYEYKINQGSYIGQHRKQLDHLILITFQPWTRPLAVQTPPSVPSPTSEKEIENYFMDYLVSDKETFDYTYGQYIIYQLRPIIDMLNQSEGHTNQATITIGDQDSFELEHPPCLRLIDFKNVEGQLQMNLFFRSWDLYTGLPTNLGGLQLLKEFILQYLTFNINDGPIVAYSSGAHIYEMYYDIVNQLNVNKI